jgi:integrase
MVGSSLLKRPEVRHFAALKAVQVGPFLRKLSESGTEPATRAALLLMLYTGQRDAALRAARWSEVDFKAATWTVPADRMKSGREHVMPLPSRRSPCSRISLSSPRRTLPHVREPGKGRIPDREHAAHGAAPARCQGDGARVAVAVDGRAQRARLQCDAVERQLDHAQEDKVRAAYVRSDSCRTVAP